MRRRRAGGAPRAYSPLLAAAGYLREALESLEGHEVIALDGVDAIAGNREDEVALFDFHNRAPPPAWPCCTPRAPCRDGLPLGLPDLRSRLSQCVRIALPVLDDAGRAAVLRERAQRRGLVIDDAAIEWLLTLAAANWARWWRYWTDSTVIDRWRPSGESPCRSCVAML